jgi:hypothetical protein
VNTWIQKKSLGISSEVVEMVFWRPILGVILCGFEKIGHHCVHLLFGSMFTYGHLRVDNVWGNDGK